jgi:hypothetical protein
MAELKSYVQRLALSPVSGLVVTMDTKKVSEILVFMAPMIQVKTPEILSHLFNVKASDLVYSGH